MSAIRNSLGKNVQRNSRASPYARSRSKSKRWGLSSIWNYFYPREEGEEGQSNEGDISAAESTDLPSHELIQPLADRVEGRNGGIHARPHFPLPRNNINADVRQAGNPLLRTRHELAPHVAENPPPPPQTPSGRAEIGNPLKWNDFAPSPGSSPRSQQEAVTRYILEREREGRPLNALEIEGLIALLRKAAEEEYQREHFTFKTSTSEPPDSLQQQNGGPSGRFAGPSSGFATSTSLPALSNPARSSLSPTRKLSRNPNGEYCWTGGGSARASYRGRSRSSSPFRSSSTGTPQMEGKRRRVGDELHFSTTEPFGVASSQSMPALTNVIAGRNSSDLALKMPMQTAQAQIHPLRASIQPRTAPVKPSPLRQSYTETSPKSTSHPQEQHQITSNSPLAFTRSTTHAASVLSEIIGRVTPPAKPDVSNPYQTASPVKPKPKEKKKPVNQKAKGRIDHADAMDVAKTADTETPSPREIIEATVPKGAKRSRPPPSLGKSNGTPSLVMDVAQPGRRMQLSSAQPKDLFSNMDAVEEEVEETERPTSKKQKKSMPVTIEEVEDEEEISPSLNTKYMRPSEVVEPGDDAVNGSKAAYSTGDLNLGATEGSASTPNLFGLKSNPFGSKSSLPKEPSKLRTSFIAEEDDIIIPEKKPITAPPKAPLSKEVNTALPTSIRAPLQLPRPNGVGVDLKTASRSKDPKEIALAVDENALPVYSFAFMPTPVESKYTRARDVALAADEITLPKYGFYGFNNREPRKSVFTQPITEAAAAAIQSTESKGTWTSDNSTGILKNIDSDKAKRTIGDTARPVVASAQSATGFNWAAAGGKLLASNAGNSNMWTCSLCSLQNPASATDKCTICDAPRPS